MIPDKKSFSEKVLKAKGLQVVQFYAEWSGPCQVMAPIFKDLYRTYKRSANFVSIDIETSSLLKNELGITELPTILFYDNGVLIDHVNGMLSKNDLINKLENLIRNTTTNSLTN